MSPPDPPGIPGRNLRGTQLPPRKDPRTDSGGAMPILIPEQRAPRVETAPAPRQSVFAQLATSFRPSQGAVNLIWVLGALGLTGGGAYAMNRGPVHDDVRVATLEAKLESQKAEINQGKDLQRLAIKRQKALEAMVGAAFARGACVTRTKGAREVQVCGSILLEGFPSEAAKMNSESIGDPPVFKAKIDGKTTPEWPE